MKHIWLENYRCFRERQEARLAPLTLLVGDNSTGKTSFLAMIRALWDVAYRNRVPNFNEEPYDLGKFDEIAHFRGGKGDRATCFAGGFQIALRSWPNERQADNWTVEFSKQDAAPRPARLRIANHGGSLWMEHRYDESKVRWGTPWGNGVVDSPAGFAIVNKQLPPLWMFEFKKARMSEQDQQAIGELVSSADLWRYARPIYAGAPVRSKPKRTYDPGYDGDDVPMFLANQYFGSKTHWADLVEVLEHFGKDAGLFDEITVKPLGKQDGLFQLQIRRFHRRAKGPRRNLMDVGYGVSQVLPVVTEVLRKSAATIFLLQQPEVHLHPSAQAALGSLFCRIAGRDRQLIVETHSDHLLDRVRMDVRDGTGALKPEDVSILYFERGNLDVRIHSLRIDHEGNVLDAPPSYGQFFMDEVKRSLWKQGPGK